MDQRRRSITSRCRDRHPPVALLIPVLATLAGCEPSTAPAPPVEITVSPTALELEVGERAGISVSVQNGSLSVDWSTSNASVATVDGSGFVTGVGPGTATITATSLDDPSKSASTSVTVAASTNTGCDDAIGTVSVGSSVSGSLASTDCLLQDGSHYDQWSFTLGSGSTVTIDLTSAAFDPYLWLFDADGTTVLDSDDDGGTGSSSRIQMSLPAGTYLVIVESYSPGATGSYTLSVQAGGTTSVQVTVSPSAATLTVGESFQFQASVSGTSNTGVQWSSSAEGVATVNSAGTVEAIGVGTAVIRATSVADPTAFGTATVTVSSGSGSITIVVTNALLHDVNIEVNGVAQGFVPAGETAQTTIAYTSAVTMEWTLVRSTTNEGQAIGDVISGTFATIDDPGSEINYTIDAVVGDTYIFRPLIVNQTSVALVMGVNEGLQAQNRCNCVVPAGSSGTQIGYYRLFSNSNVRAYRSSTGYTGGYIYWSNFASNVNTTTGAITLTATQPPPGADPSSGSSAGVATPGASGGAERVSWPPSDVEDVPRRPARDRR